MIKRIKYHSISNHPPTPPWYRGTGVSKKPENRWFLPPPSAYVPFVPVMSPVSFLCTIRALLGNGWYLSYLPFNASRAPAGPSLIQITPCKLNYNSLQHRNIISRGLFTIDVNSRIRPALYLQVQNVQTADFPDLPTTLRTIHFWQSTCICGLRTIQITVI